MAETAASSEGWAGTATGRTELGSKGAGAGATDAFGAAGEAEASGSGGALRMGGRRAGAGGRVLVVFGIAGVPAAGRMDGTSVLGIRRGGGASGGTRTDGIAERGVGDVIGAGAGGGNATGVSLRDGIGGGAGAFCWAAGARICVGSISSTVTPALDGSALSFASGNSIVAIGRS
jgi:hypothetical protein